MLHLLPASRLSFEEQLQAEDPGLAALNVVGQQQTHFRVNETTKSIMQAAAAQDGRRNLQARALHTCLAYGSAPLSQRQRVMMPAFQLGKPLAAEQHAAVHSSISLQAEVARAAMLQHTTFCVDSQTPA